MVVNEFCARTGAAPKMANATSSVLTMGVPLLFVDVKACRASLGLPTSPWCHDSFVCWLDEMDRCVALPKTRFQKGSQRNWALSPATALPLKAQ